MAKEDASGGCGFELFDAVLSAVEDDVVEVEDGVLGGIRYSAFWRELKLWGGGVLE